MTNPFDLGIMFRCQYPPEDLVHFVQQAERAGLDEAWVVEDCFFAGGISSAAIALAHTEQINIGLGIVPAVVRNAAFTAMEFATLARLYPGRFLPGIGHGVGDWMKQIGAFPPSQLTALEEVTSAVRGLLAGDLVDVDGGYVQLDKVKLDFPPAQVPGVSLGVRGPKSLRLSGRVADGTIMAEYASPAYVAWAREQITAGQMSAGRDNDTHRITLYTWCVIDEDHDAAVAKLRPMAANLLTAPWKRTYLEPMGVLAEADALVVERGDNLAERIPDEWVSQLGVVGTVDECAAAVHKLVEAGADSVVFVPVENDLQTLQVIKDDLLPTLR